MPAGVPTLALELGETELPPPPGGRALRLGASSFLSYSPNAKVRWELRPPATEHVGRNEEESLGPLLGGRAKKPGEFGRICGTRGERPKKVDLHDTLRRKIGNKGGAEPTQQSYNPPSSPSRAASFPGGGEVAWLTTGERGGFRHSAPGKLRPRPDIL